MKRITTVFILLFIISTAFASNDQKADSTKTKFQRVAIGVNFSNEIVPAYVAEEIGYFAGKTGDPLRNRLRYGYTASINVQVNITKHWSLETGIQFADKGFETKYIFVGPAPGIDNAWESDFYYTSIPVKVNYTAGKKKVKFIAAVGGAMDILTVPKYYRKFNFTPMVSAGMDYGFCKHFHLRVEPTFRYSALTFSESRYPLAARFWSVGLNTGFYYAF